MVSATFCAFVLLKLGKRIYVNNPVYFPCDQDLIFNGTYSLTSQCQRRLTHPYTHHVQLQSLSPLRMPPKQPDYFKGTESANNVVEALHPS